MNDCQLLPETSLNDQKLVLMVNKIANALQHRVERKNEHMVR